MTCVTQSPGEQCNRHHETAKATIWWEVVELSVKLMESMISHGPAITLSILDGIAIVVILHVVNEQSMYLLCGVYYNN